MDANSHWLEVLKGQISEQEVREMLSRDVPKLDGFLQRDPQAGQYVMTLLERRLSGKIGVDSWELMHTSLSQFFGDENLAYLLYWVVGVENPTANRIEEVAKSAPPRALAFLRTVVGVYGLDLSTAYALWNEHPDNWRTLQREVYYDLINQRHHLKVRIQKYNGEETVIEGPADFILNLARVLILTARLVGTREAFSADSIDSFLEESRLVNELLTATEEEAPAELSESEAQPSKEA